MTAEPLDLFVVEINKNLKQLGSPGRDASEVKTVYQLYQGLSPKMIAIVFFLDTQMRRKGVDITTLSKGIFDDDKLMEQIYRHVHTQKKKTLDDDEKRLIKMDIIRYIVMLYNKSPFLTIVTTEEKK